MSDSPAVILYDADAHPVAVVLDGSTYRLSAASKISRASDGAYINPASEEKLEAARALLGTIDGDTSNLDVALSTRATETTLGSIKDTDGVKKITDQLPAGTNEIGKVAQGTKAAGDGGWPQVLYDAAGHPVAVVLDNSIYRLETRSTLTGQIKGAGAEQKVTTISDVETANEMRLQTEARLAPGSQVSIGTAIPSNPGDLKIEFLKNVSAYSMLVDGSTTPVVFSFGPDAGTVLTLQSLLVVFTSDDFSFDGASFGPNTLLTNGILVETYIDTVATEIFNIKQNEDFLRVPGRIPLVNNTGPKDVLGVSFDFGGLIRLTQADGDLLRVTIRDDLTSVKLKYLTATAYGVVT